MVLDGRRRAAAGAARAAAARQALARGAAVRQPERRPGAGLLRGRDRRGHHHRPVPARWLFVIARNSSFAYRGKAVDVRQVGRELGVRYVLEGSVRKAGERVRITGQLIDAWSGAHLWAERFDGTLADVFELQDRVAEGVAGAIEPTLRRAEIERARRKPTESLDAYDLYLRALPHVFTTMAEGIREALRLLDRALALDPGYAAALGFKAWCHLQCAPARLDRRRRGRTHGRRAGRPPGARLGPGRSHGARPGRLGGVAVGARPRGGARGAGPGGGAQPELRAGVRRQRPGALLRRGLRHGDRARPAGAAAEPVRPAGLQAADRAGLRPPVHRTGTRKRRSTRRGRSRPTPVSTSAHTILVASLVELGRLEEARAGGRAA